MIFSEIYGTYYNTMAKIIEKAIDATLTEKDVMTIINENAFSDSFLYILPAIKNEQWQIITKTFETPIQNKPQMPLTLLQKRWLKAISKDARVKLFIDNIDGLDDIEPLYKQSDFYYFDIINDGDDFENPEYIKNFRTILTALKEQKKLKISYESGKGKKHTNYYAPYKLEYSGKDDKFRLIAYGSRKYDTINLGRITNCELANVFDKRLFGNIRSEKSVALLEITDERNAMERAMLHFANYEKVTEKISNYKYKMELTYNKYDETEVLIRILSFGHMIKVLSPNEFINLITERLDKQKKLLTT